MLKPQHACSQPTPEQKAHLATCRDHYQRALAQANTELAFASLKAFSGQQHGVDNLMGFIQASDKIIALCLRHDDVYKVTSLYQWVCARLNTALSEPHKTGKYQALCRYAIDNYRERADSYCQQLGGNVIPFSRKGLCTLHPHYNSGLFY